MAREQDTVGRFGGDEFIMIGRPVPSEIGTLRATGPKHVLDSNGVIGCPDDPMGISDNPVRFGRRDAAAAMYTMSWQCNHG
jgi:GGDEF domain-containing protein